MTWYPAKHSPIRTRAKIMREAYMKDFNVKEIAGYFNLSLHQVYKHVRVKKLKLKRMEGRLLQNGIK